jgi:hypothetical protein
MALDGPAVALRSLKDQEPEPSVSDAETLMEDTSDANSDSTEDLDQTVERTALTIAERCAAAASEACLADEASEDADDASRLALAMLDAVNMGAGTSPLPSPSVEPSVFSVAEMSDDGVDGVDEVFDDEHLPVSFPWLESSSESSMIHEDDPMYDLRCVRCGELVCSRGQRVDLCSDTTRTLFSTDFTTAQVIEDPVAQPRPFSWADHSCGCLVIDTHCVKCEGSLGYHVVEVCGSCRSEDHNAHFWMFYPERITESVRVDGEGKPLSWSHGAATALEDDALGDVVEGEDECPICRSAVRAPIGLDCGHTFCRVCITRALDLDRRCPCCRTAVSIGGGALRSSPSSPSSRQTVPE